MTGVVVVLRPEPGSSATLAAGTRIGLHIEASPLFEIRPMAWDPPPQDEVDGLLLGSANAVRQAGPALAAFRDRPAYVVGEATAKAAESAGLTVAGIGGGHLQPLVDSLVPPLRLLRVTGAEHVDLVPPAGIAIATRIAYESAPLPMSEGLVAQLEQDAIVLLHSAVAARHFAAECDRLGIARSRVRLAALGPRIAAAAGGGWRDARTAAAPDEVALLALAHQMCHEPTQR